MQSYDGVRVRVDRNQTALVEDSTLPRWNRCLELGSIITRGAITMDCVVAALDELFPEIALSAERKRAKTNDA